MNRIKRTYLLLLIVTLAFGGWIAHGQSRNGNWPAHGGDAQRSAWEATDANISTTSVKDFQLLWKIQLETRPNTLRPVMPPLILGRLISYRGFRELAFVATNADIVYAIDADLGQVFWQRHLEYSSREPQGATSTWECPGGLTATPAMPITGRGASGGAPAAGGGRGNPFIGGAASVYTISSDGRLHRLNTSTGDDMTQPVSVIPPNARATNIVMVDNVIYTTTTNECNGVTNAVWAVDLTAEESPKSRSFPLNRESGFNVGQPFVGSDGTVYVETTVEPASHPLRHAIHRIMTFSPRELRLQKGVTLSVAYESGTDQDRGIPGGNLSLGLLNYRDRQLVVTADERSSSWLVVQDLEGILPVSTTPAIVQAAPRKSPLRDRGITGNVATWQDAAGVRWILAPVEGPLNTGLKARMTNGPVTSGFIAAFKVEDQGGQPSLTAEWISRDIVSPQTPVVANGVVFVLSSGEFTRRINETGSMEERPKIGAHATLYALDARTGKELYSSANFVTVPASLTGLTVANGRAYFGGLDGALYAFGIPMER